MNSGVVPPGHEPAPRAVESRESMDPQLAADFLGTWGYPAFVVLLLATAVGSPLTEDLLLLAGGYLGGARVFSWPVAAPLALGGLLAADTLLYAFGRKLRTHSLRRGFVRRMIRPGRLRIATRWFARFGEGVVFLARLVPGTRMVVFVSAGLRGIPLWRFLALDGLAALIWVPLLLLIGEQLGERAGDLGRTLDWVGDRVLLLVGVALAAWLAHRAWVARERRRFGPSDAEP